MIEFIVPAISCGHCVKSVTQAVKALDASAQVDVDLPTHRVRVQTALDASKVSAALADAGYPPQR